MAVQTTTISQPIAATFLIQRFGDWVYAESTYTYTHTVNPHTDPAAYSKAGVPQIGDAWSATGDFAFLKLEERELMSITNQDATNFRIKLKLIYRLQRTQGSNFAANPLRGGASLHQIKTRETRVSGTTEELKVDYTTGELDKDGNPIIDKQTGEADVLAAQSVQVREIVIATNNPESIASAWINHVNQGAWRGAGDSFWLCTDVQYERVSRSTSTSVYAFIFEFELSDSPIGWRYEVVYKAPDGKVPQDIDFGNGKTQFDWHNKINYSSLFP